MDERDETEIWAHGAYHYAAKPEGWTDAQWRASNRVINAYNRGEIPLHEMLARLPVEPGESRRVQRRLLRLIRRLRKKNIYVRDSR